MTTASCNTEFKCENCQNFANAPEGRHCVAYIDQPPMNMSACPGRKDIVLAPNNSGTKPVEASANMPTGEYLHLRRADPTVTRNTH